jgi:alkanesulfonate monooxygenase SsuD/methylene tetrahydromethanopterin reductase-like flavin-dependent oxidoreductase (luciferase family)
MTLQVFITPPDTFFRAGVGERRDLLASMADVGLDGVFYADHVSFRNGAGMDGLILLAGLSQLHPTLTVEVGVYLLPLRHPVLVARQLSTLWELAPGRIAFGVGVGGEDRHEITSCEVDPRTRGVRCDESLEVLARLLAGETVTHHGRFFHLDEVLIRPVPDPAIPVYVGGRSDAAIRRTGRYGEGWIGTWCSAERFRAAVALCDETAAGAGRAPVAWHHQLQTWVGVGRDRDRARNAVAGAMERFYGVPFSAFERYTPYGSPAEVAEFLRPYVDAGVQQFNITPCGDPDEDLVALTGEIRRALLA